MIQLHRLEGFYWVARTGGYARAARAFPYPITQPAVHQQVKKLEADLGSVLFERVAKDRMQLTAAGERLYAFVAPFFEQLPGVLRSIEAGNYEGVLRIHAAPLMMRHLLPAWIARLREAHAGIRIELRELTVDELAPLRAGDADLVVDYLSDPPSDIGTLQVATSRAFLVLPREHALADRPDVSLADLAEDTFISYSPSSLAYTLQMKAFAEHGLEPKSALSADSADTILGFVETGLGFSLVPSLEPQGPAGERLVARPLERPAVEFPIYAAWRLDTPENPLLDAALETAPKPR